MAEDLVVATWATGAKWAIHTGTLPWAGTGWKVALLTSSFTDTTVTTWDDVSAYEVSVSGYTAGGEALAGLEDFVSGLSHAVNATDTEIAVGADLTTAAWAVTYYEPTGQLAFFVQFVDLPTVSSGQSLILDWGNDREASGVPWANSVFDTFGVFHSSSTTNRSDFESWEDAVNRTVKFNLTFLTGNWANASLRPTSWATTKAAYEDKLDPADDWWVNRPDVTQIITCPLLYGGQTLDSALVSTAGETFWTDFGDFCWTNGYCDTHADGRPFIMLRPGWESDGSWYPWGMRFNGGTIAANAPKFKALYDQSRAWFDAGVIAAGGTAAAAREVLWIWNLMAADLGDSSRIALEGNVPDCDTITQDSYDTMQGSGNNGYWDPNSPSTIKTQAQKDTAYPTVRNKIMTQRTGRNWGVALAVANSKMYGLDESGAYFEEYSGQRPDAGGDHAYPAISWFADEISWQTAPAGPFGLSIMSHHILYNAVTSGDEGSTKINPAQTYSPQSRAAWLAALTPP